MYQLFPSHIANNTYSTVTCYKLILHLPLLPSHVDLLPSPRATRMQYNPRTLLHSTACHQSVSVAKALLRRVGFCTVTSSLDPLVSSDAAQKRVCQPVAGCLWGQVPVEILSLPIVALGHG